MNAVTELHRAGIVPQTQGRLTVQEVLQHAVVVQEVMRAVMKPDIHFGKIPGTDKPTLYQPGADVLCMTFRIAPEFEVEDLSTADAIRYRVTCRGVHQTSGVNLGAGIGEGSSSEEKYKWRKAVSEDEFEATLPAMRRIKFGKNYKAKQVRTEPADVANTVLKMAAKRAKIAMVLNVTGASDMFGQDLEDLDGVLQEHLAGAHGDHAAPPAQQGPATWPDDKLNERESRCREWAAAGKTAKDAIDFFASKGTLTPEQEARVRAWMAPLPAPPASDSPNSPATEANLPWKD